MQILNKVYIKNTMFVWIITLFSSIVKLFSQSFYNLAVIICALLSLFYIDLYHKLRDDVNSIKVMLDNKKK